jgi:VWFA-related protein
MDLKRRPMLIKRSQFLLALLALLYSPILTTAQEPKEDIVRVRTRVVFVDTLVQDKKTGAPIADLTRENFEVLADGNPRTLSYFSRAGEGRRRPLALVLALDLWGGRSFSYLKKAEVAEQLVAAINKLSPEDEVGVMLMWAEKDKKGSDLFLGKCQMVESLTRDREKTAAALRAVPPRAAQLEAYFKSFPAKRPDLSGPVEFPTSASQGGLACASDEVSRLAAGEKANAQVVTIVLTDDLVPFDLDDRAESMKELLASGVTVSGLLMGDVSFADKVFFGITKSYVRALGSGLSSVDYFARQTGGEAVRVSRSEEFAGAVGRLIDGLAARYSLGFTLGEGERDDGRLHKLEVKVKARDAHGKERKLSVSARRGYYMKIQDATVQK